MITPISRLPESETVHFCSTITEGCVTVRCTTQIEISQFFKIGTNDLISVHEDAAKKKNKYN